VNRLRAAARDTEPMITSSKIRAPDSLCIFAQRPEIVVRENKDPRSLESAWDYCRNLIFVFLKCFPHQPDC
jgi:hypothetical protein